MQVASWSTFSKAKPIQKNCEHQAMVTVLAGYPCMALIKTRLLYATGVLPAPVPTSPVPRCPQTDTPQTNSRLISSFMHDGQGDQAHVSIPTEKV